MSIRNNTLVALTLTLCACGTDSGEPVAMGEYALSIYGEEFVEEGIPVEAFVDGWSVEFDAFLIAVPEVRVAEGTEFESYALEGPFVFDLVQGSDGAGHQMGQLKVPQATYSALDYTVAPVSGDVQGNAGDAAQALIDNGYSVWVSGVARKEGAEKRFEWGFTGARTYTACETSAQVTQDAGRSQLTIHADHLFYDDLESEEPNVAFDLIASADLNEDDIITMEELAATDITAEARYQVGSRDITDLWAFIEAQVGTLGHIDGEGHCN